MQQTIWKPCLVSRRPIAYRRSSFPARPIVFLTLHPLSELCAQNDSSELCKPLHVRTRLKGNSQSFLLVIIGLTPNMNAFWSWFRTPRDVRIWQRNKSTPCIIKRECEYITSSPRNKWQSYRRLPAINSNRNRIGSHIQKKSRNLLSKMARKKHIHKISGI
jgi:hypothetical protein